MADAVVSRTLSKKQRYDKLLGFLDTDRTSFMTMWRELNDYILPTRGRFFITDRNRGDRRSKFIVDSTATFAARTLSSGMMAGLTSPARPWKRLTTPDPDLREVASVKQWLHIVNQRMDTVFAQSNWYNKLPLLYDDMGVFATGAMMIEEDDETVIRCISFPIGSYWIGNDAKGRTRVFAREFQMTVRQIVERFGDNGKDFTNISSSVQEKWKNGNLDDWLDVRHIIMPNNEYDSSKLDSRYKQFSSCYYEKSGPPDKLLEEKGYDEWPVLCGRWSTTGEDTYGTNSPGITVIGDVKALQLGEKRAAQAMEKQLNPPLAGPPSLRGSRVSLLPADVTYVQEGQNATLRPIHEVKPSLQDWEYRQEQIRKRINTGFYADLFLMLTYADAQRGVQPPTAAEIAVRQEEKLLAIGPVLEGLNEDVLDPAIDRVFAVMVRAGLIPPPPPELQGVQLKVEYISIMAQAQKSIGIGGLERFAGFVNTMAAEDPAVLDKVDRDQMIDEYADMTGVPPRIVVPDDQVAQIRADRAKQQQAEQATKLAAMESQSARNLSAARVAPDNALGQLLQSGGPAAPLNPLAPAA